MSDPKKVQNLARIRDNQRRSRARRKEYIQELEARLRDCEQAGVEASAEIQCAARRVLEENRKLRTLLHQHGVPESEIVLAMAGLSEIPYDQTSAAPSLGLMLERRATSDRSPFSALPATPHSSNTMTTSQTPTIPPLSVPGLGSMSSNDSPSPTSIVSSRGTSPLSYRGTPYMDTSLASASEMSGEEVPLYMSYEQPSQIPWPHAHNQQYVADPVSYYDTSSCVDAANIIRSMRTDAGPELEVQLGCRVPGQQCYVTNSVVFNVMDRYTSPQGV